VKLTTYLFVLMLKMHSPCISFWNIVYVYELFYICVRFEFATVSHHARQIVCCTPTLLPITNACEKFCALHTHIIYDCLVFPDAALSPKVIQHHYNDFILVMGLSRHGRSLTALGSLLCLLSTMTMNILPATIWKQEVQNSTALGGRTIRTCPRSLCISNISVLFYVIKF
jgi:hypothetical protein